MRLKHKVILFLINKEYIYLNIKFLLILAANKPEYVKGNHKRSFFLIIQEYNYLNAYF
jgi:hypothetical protein